MRLDAARFIALASFFGAAALVDAHPHELPQPLVFFGVGAGVLHPHELPQLFFELPSSEELRTFNPLVAGAHAEKDERLRELLRMRVDERSGAEEGCERDEA
ncbi:MAG TPA: hypothetical protein VM925_08265, partial [Labilithrix sp.]|nr:hypothetical protein [Labilithrix sp.]